MHFTYKYINHEIEKFQAYLDFLFYEVWCVASGDFDEEKLNGNPELKQIYIDLGNIDINQKGGTSAKFFNSHIEKIYAEFLKLDQTQIERLKVGYAANNNIEAICTDKSTLPLLYSELKEEHPELTKLLKSFYEKLYGSESPFNLKIFGNLNKYIIRSHYFDFMKANKREVCPFCGLTHLKGNNHDCREAYDHYLPKSLYPFSPLNFKNLAPICHECNSSYKKVKIPIEQRDPLNKKMKRGFAFYPYAEQHPVIKFDVKLKSTDIKNLTPTDIDVEISSAGSEEQIESWKRVFGLDERYKATLCNPDDGRAWVNSIIEGYDNALSLGTTLTREQYYQAQYIDAAFQPVTEKGFIKAPFLAACKDGGVFDNQRLSTS